MKIKEFKQQIIDIDTKGYIGNYDDCENLFNFLVAHDMVENYIDALKDTYNSYPEPVNIDYLDDVGAFGKLILYSDTKEGGEYWYEKGELWENYIQENK